MGRHSPKPNTFWRQFSQIAYEWVSAMISALLILAVIFLCMMQTVTVYGTSMVPTLQNGDRLLISRGTAPYEVGDIVIIDRYVQEPLIKRVMAMPGDTLDIGSNGEVYRNGVLLTEPYIQGQTFPLDVTGVITVPEGYVFVMGDNRPASLDSRSNEVGLISLEDVVGKVTLRLWPLSTFGGVYGTLPDNR